VTPALVPVPRASRFEDVDELTLLACLIFGEARGEPVEGRIAVAWAVRNRVTWPVATRFGAGWQGVILRPLQFSSFNANDPNSKKLLEPLKWGAEASWAACFEAACAVYFQLVPDPTGGANHYHTTGVAPSWSRGVEPTAVIGNHRFFRLS
jgi:N-acetylmuramoyl-L-alanine amidase